MVEAKRRTRAASPFSLILGSITSLTLSAFYFSSWKRLEGDGWSETVVGLVVAAYPATIVLVNPLASRFVQRAGRTAGAMVGIATLAAGMACFGMAGGRQAAAAMSAKAVLCTMTAARCFAAVGAAIANIALTSAVMDLFSASGALASVLALNEVFISLGFTLGPVAGGVLFELGGFVLPFLVAAGLVASALPFSSIALSRLPRRGSAEFAEALLAAADDEADARARLDPRLSREQKLKMGVAAGSAFVAVLSFAEFNVLLEDYCRGFGLSTPTIGALFAGLAFSYSLSSPWAGRVTDQSGARMPMAAGLLVSALGRLVVVLPGQAALSRASGTSERKLRTISAAVGLVLFGSGQAFGLVPSLPAMKTMAGDFPSEPIVSAFYMALSSAEAIGSLSAGALGDAIGFRWTFSVFGAVSALWCLAVLAVGPFEAPDAPEGGGDEETPLLSPSGPRDASFRAAALPQISTQDMRSERHTQLFRAAALAQISTQRMRFAHMSSFSSLGASSLHRQASKTLEEACDDDDLEYARVASRVLSGLRNDYYQQ